MKKKYKQWRRVISAKPETYLRMCSLAERLGVSQASLAESFLCAGLDAHEEPEISRARAKEIIRERVELKSVENMPPAVMEL